MSKPRCEHCPIPPGETCHSDRHPWMCRYAATGHPRRIAAVLGRNAIAEGQAPTPPRQLPPAKVPVAVSLRRIANAKACPARELSVPCGCSGLARCLLGKGKNGITSLSECIDCSNPSLTIAQP